ncbi:MAG: hypothetical protein KAJ39_10235 [Gammaproteobacteria bacterium]|nr:hypothetical protein [Gammaproteobacteria bacterium]
MSKNQIEVPSSKKLNDLLVIVDQVPDDFFTNPVYDKELDRAISASNNLVYNLDDAGEKQAKQDATNINKFAKMFDKFIAATFKHHTESVTAWRNGKKSKTKLLLENRQKLIDQFAEKRAEKIKEIELILHESFDEIRYDLSIDDHYFSDESDISPLIKLSGTLTPKGELTKKAVDFLTGLANAELAEQNRIESRHLILENRCLKEGINPPLTHIHFGSVFLADDDMFNDKVEVLIAAEIDRKAEMEARVIKEQEAKKQAEIDAALKAQQAEANRIAKEEANKTALECAEQSKVTPENEQPKTWEEQQGLVEIDDDDEPVKQEPAPAKKQAVVNGKHQVEIQVTFTMAISDRVKDKAVQEHFLSQLPEKLKSSIDSLTTRTI